LYEWYEKHLGIQREPHGQGAMFRWREADDQGREGMTGWSLFQKESTYFEPSRAPFMINYRVDDLDRLLAALEAEGVEIDTKREDYDYGRFAWIMDPEGNRIELWEPPKS
jgi:predicted enzyme related to lactoylglutathione lyase